MKQITLIVLVFVSIYVNAQEVVNADRIDTSIKVDGSLNEKEWESASTYSGFSTVEPSYNKEATIQPKVKMLYDDNQLYFGAFIPTENIEDVQRQFRSRDSVGGSDWFLVLIDTYGNGTSASKFLVSAAGVQFDAIDNGTKNDVNWDAVWDSEVKIADNGWYVEMAIPYAALRFSDKKEQDWKINFVHKCNATGEKSTFYEIDPEVKGFINQTAQVKGIHDIHAPLRLSLTPYLTSYYNNYKSTEGKMNDNFNVSGGLDLKYGINDAFTLDMILIPDFGQVRADDSQLNLSPFEVQFSENRPFFTEGVELFRRANIFYSRRIGGTPVGFNDAYSDLNTDEVVKSNPLNSILANATKISGRTDSGWGIGLLNAVSKKSFAEIENTLGEVRTVETAPLTNYNVTVIDKNLPHNSYISVINTNVTRFNSLYHNANVTGVDGSFRIFDENVGVNFSSSLSQEINKGSENVYGYKFDANVEKISGAFNYGFVTRGISKEYDINDLGFSTYTNVSMFKPTMSYRFNDGLWKFANVRLTGDYTMFTKFDDQKIMDHIFSISARAFTKERWFYEFGLAHNSDGYSQFESQTPGYLMKTVGSLRTSLSVGSDGRKKFRVRTGINLRKGHEEGFYAYGIKLSPRYRVNNHLSVKADCSIQNVMNSRKLAALTNEKIVIGLRNRSTVTNTLTINLGINDKISLLSRVRHYWTKYDYSKYFELQKDANLSASAFTDDTAREYSAFNANTEFRWRFAPGSDIIAVWQNNIAGSSSYAQDEDEHLYLNSLGDLSKFDQNNSFSIRVLYYLDAGSMI